MPEGITAESLVNNIMETISDGVSKHKKVSFFEEGNSNSAASQFNRLFGREKPVHHLLGGGKCRTRLYIMFIILASIDSRNVSINNRMNV